MSGSPNIDEEYEVLELIGKGSFGSVRKVRRIRDRKLLVRKEIPYGHMNQKERSQLIAEFRILSELKHPNIVQYVHHAHIPEQHLLYLYMEYCDGGDLQHIIKHYKTSNEYLPEGVIWSIFTQILMALYRCHYGVNSPTISNILDDMKHPAIDDSTRVIIHRDIKPDNLFLSDGNFKLGDFGLAKSLNYEMEFATTCVGTPYYMSPEVLLDRPYSPLCDIWSLGCVIYELCSLHPPFQAKTHLQLQQKIQSGLYPSIPEHYSSNLKDVIAMCIQVDQTRRASTFDLLQNINFKIQAKDLQLQRYESSLKNFEQELIVKEKDLDHTKQQITEELNYQRTILEQEIEEIRVNYQKEFQYVVEKEVRAIMKQYNINTPRPKPAQTIHSTPSDFSMAMSPSPSHQGSKSLKGKREKEYETPMKQFRKPLQSLDNDPPSGKKYSKPVNNGYSVQKSANNTLLTKNSRLFENARVLHYDEDLGLPSPFNTKTLG